MKKKNVEFEQVLRDEIYRLCGKIDHELKLQAELDEKTLTRFSDRQMHRESVGLTLRYQKARASLRTALAAYRKNMKEEK